MLRCRCLISLEKATRTSHKGQIQHIYTKETNIDNTLCSVAVFCIHKWLYFLYTTRTEYQSTHSKPRHTFTQTAQPSIHAQRSTHAAMMKMLGRPGKHCTVLVCCEILWSCGQSVLGCPGSNLLHLEPLPAHTKSIRFSLPTYALVANWVPSTLSTGHNV